ncbi:MAG: hypothetical protein O3C05_02875, partial [Proteobacteria bacterium]|nr:hypothetical protein [Pseudomonadota bacterium]
SLMKKTNENIKDDKIIAGVIYSLRTQEIYWAKSGIGAYFVDAYDRNHKIKASSYNRHKETFLCDIDSIDLSNSIENLCNKERILEPRILGCHSLGLAYLAHGKLDACVYKKHDFYKIAAGLLFLKEAGIRHKINDEEILIAYR